jgi:N-acetylglucosamine malate deacetylase 2
MTATSTAVALQSAAQEFADADARPPDPPGLGHAEDRNIADETQPGAIAKPGTETAETGAPGRTSGSVPARALPRARNVLAVIARPGQESAGLGALLYAFRRRGARLALLCLTRGEASPLNSTCERLETRRTWELQVAAGLLGISSVTVSDYPDGGLSLSPVQVVTERIRRVIREYVPDLLLVVDPAAAGDPDDAQVAKAACLAAESTGLPVLARALPGARTGWVIELGADASAARAIQRCAAAAHVSQSAAGPQVRRRLDLLGSREPLRWLVPPAAGSRAGEAAPAAPFLPDRLTGHSGSKREHVVDPGNRAELHPSTPGLGRGSDHTPPWHQP